MTTPLTPEEAVEKALLYAFQLSNIDYEAIKNWRSPEAFIRALEQDGFTVIRGERRERVDPDPWPSESRVGDCPRGCGCSIFSDAAPNDCGCDGPCTTLSGERVDPDLRAPDGTSEFVAFAVEYLALTLGEDNPTIKAGRRIIEALAATEAPEGKE